MGRIIPAPIITAPYFSRRVLTEKINSGSDESGQADTFCGLSAPCPPPLASIGPVWRYWRIHWRYWRFVGAFVGAPVFPTKLEFCQNRKSRVLRRAMLADFC